MRRLTVKRFLRKIWDAITFPARVIDMLWCESRDANHETWGVRKNKRRKTQ